MRQHHPNHLRDIDYVKKLKKPLRHPADEWVLSIMYHQIARPVSYSDPLVPTTMTDTPCCL